MVNDATALPKLPRTDYATRGRQVAHTLICDADRLQLPGPTCEVHLALAKRIDRCANAFAGRHDKRCITVAVAFLFWLNEGCARDAGADHTQAGFCFEYPEHGRNLVADDWAFALDAIGTIGRRGRKAAPWNKLSRILTKAGCPITPDSLRKLHQRQAAATGLESIRREHFERHTPVRAVKDESIDGDDDRLVRQGYARRARMIADALLADADRIECARDSVDVDVFDRISRCWGTRDGGGAKWALDAGVRFIYWIREGAALEAKSREGRAPGEQGVFDAATEAQTGFEREYPGLAVTLERDDWIAAVMAYANIGKRGKAEPWERLAKIFTKTGFKIRDGESLKKAYVRKLGHA